MQFDLGGLYLIGNNVEKDYVKALDWFRRAAEQQHGRSMASLSLLYNNGYGVELNLMTALMRAELAIRNGNESAGTLKLLISQRVSTEEALEAQKLAEQCVSQKYKSCAS